jgi:ubiquitin-conjugating enzyme E2 variant
MPRWLEILGLILCGLLQLALTVKFWGQLSFVWMIPLVILALVAADLVAALIHWFFDTWFTPETPIIGGIIAPFREHHIDQLAILKNDFVGTAGGPSWIGVFVLVPVIIWGGPVWAFFLGWLANFASQGDTVHRAIHLRERAPWPIKVLQRLHLVQTFQQHDGHHTPPHHNGWAILTGWWNPVLDVVLPRVERAIRSVLPRPA